MQGILKYFGLLICFRSPMETEIHHLANGAGVVRFSQAEADQQSLPAGALTLAVQQQNSPVSVTRSGDVGARGAPVTAPATDAAQGLSGRRDGAQRAKRILAATGELWLSTARAKKRQTTTAAPAAPATMRGGSPP